MSVKDYEDKMYSGVLGKILGVYLGRPVEGWSYDKIDEMFGEISYYVNDEINVPLIVADDDISGTFAFFRAIADNGFKKETSAKEFGDTWLNYIIENKTILWWGGLGRSTEHTAFLNLKNGIDAPLSGAIETNGRTLAEQIGAQIFIDAIAMACPNDPELAVKLVRRLASVSHDGIAIEAACHLAALQSMAFCEKNIDALLDKARLYVNSKELLDIVDDVRDICKKESDWRKVREYIDCKYGYDIYVGCCHMVPNHAMVIASIILGGDDFSKSICIASSAGFDTDCNAGNVGAFNGIRLGIDCINKGVNLREPVSDLMYVVSADGGSVVTDAVLETKKIFEVYKRLKKEEPDISSERYTFEYSGSTQGFMPCTYNHKKMAKIHIYNLNEESEENGLCIECKNVARDVSANISTQTFIDFSKLATNFSTVASPTLYSSQVVHTTASVKTGESVYIKPYILYYGIDDEVKVLYGDSINISKNKTTFSFKVPDTKGMSIFKLGYQVLSQERFSGTVVLHKINWSGAPTDFSQRGMLMNSIWNTNPKWLLGFASSAVQFAADFKRTYCISNVSDNGVVTIGTKDWDNYSVSSTIYYSLHKEGGLVARSVGHRRFYSAVLEDFKKAKIVMKKDSVTKILTEVSYQYEEDKAYKLKFQVLGNKLTLYINDEKVLEISDDTYKNGGAGFVVSNGTMTADSFIIEG